MKVALGTSCCLTTTKALQREIEAMEHHVVDVNNGELQDAATISIKIAQLVNDNIVERGIIIDQYGQLPFMIASKFPHTMAAPVFDDYSAQLTAEHNNANIICLACAFVGEEYMIHLATKFLATPFAAGRHLVRTDMIDEILKKEEA